MNFFTHTIGTRLKASGIHLFFSFLLACVSAFLVFRIWYPYPFNVLMGGKDLFLLVMLCDLVLGPCIMFVIFNKSKPKKELKLDISIVLLLQLLALGYGLWVVFIARPVYIVFEKDLYRIVRSVDVPVELLPKIPSQYVTFPLTGPVLLSLRDFSSTQEQMNTTMLELEGVPMSSQPQFWQEYSKAKNLILKNGKPAENLLIKFPDDKNIIEEAVARSGIDRQNLVYYSLVDRKNYWTVLVNKKNLEIVGYLPVDTYGM